MSAYQKWKTALPDAPEGPTLHDLDPVKGRAGVCTIPGAVSMLRRQGAHA
jgi:hypothetical protein